MTSLGIPTIYYGEEVARDGSTWPLNRGDMPWGKRAGAARQGRRSATRTLRAYYRKLIEARRDNVALSSGTFKRLSSDGDLLVFERCDAASGNAVVVAVNRGQPEATVACVDAPTGVGAASRREATVSGAASAVVPAGRLA